MTLLDDRPIVLGREEPRLWTRPLRELTPATSAGFSAIQFAEDVLGIDLMPWQRWWLIHALELRPDGRFRFRTVLTLVARQSGKTTICKVLALWFLYVRGSKLVLGSAQDLTTAMEAWSGACDLAEEVPDLAVEIARKITSNGKECLHLTNGARYLVKATTRSAGRGLSVDGLLLLDELREQRDWAAWGALSKTTMAKRTALTVGITNQGDDQSVVLNHLRSTALAKPDQSIGIFEWSAPDGCRLDDVQAWAQANPGMGHTITEDAIRDALATDPPATFRTEVLCQRVDALDAAVDPEGWKACADPGSNLADYARQVVVCVEVAYDDHHVTAVAAAPAEDGRVRLEVLDAWKDTAAARPALRAMFERIRPRAVGWFNYGPATVLTPDLQAMQEEGLIGEKVFALVGEEMRPEAPGIIKLDAVACCQGLADLVDNRALVHSDDQLLNQHIAASVRKDQGDGWRFARRGAGRNDAAYAAAGAVYMARTLPQVEDYNPLDSVF